MPSAMQRIRDVYRVPAHRGGRVRLDWADYGEGTITGTDALRLRVRFDNGSPGICHPTWRLTYLREDES